MMFINKENASLLKVCNKCIHGYKKIDTVPCKKCIKVTPKKFIYSKFKGKD